MRRLVLSIFSLIIFALPAFAQAKHPFTFEDMMKLKRVGEPEVSPDGKWVIFSVVDVNLEANTKTPHIWIVPLAGTQEKSGVPHVSPNLRDRGSTERELIPDQDGDRPRWAPDGKRFAFLSTKEGGSQVWIADFDGASGTVTQQYRFTYISTEASGELWAPDGANILFTSDVYPECDGAPEAEAACNAKKMKEAEQSKVKAQIFAHLLYRHWNAYKDGKRTHIFVVSREMSPTVHKPNAALVDTFPRDLTPGDYDAPVFSLGGQDNYAVSPDGQEICYTSNHDKNPAASTNNDLWIVPVNSGDLVSGNRVTMIPAEARNITADNPASDSTPLYSPDGRYIAYRAQQRPGYESDRFRLMLYDRKTGRKDSVTDVFGADEEHTLIFNAWIGTFIWGRDSKNIYFSWENEGQSEISKVGDIDLIAEGKTVSVPRRVQSDGDDLALGPGDNSLVFTRMSIMAPNEIYRSTLAPEKCKDGRLSSGISGTHEGMVAKECELPKPEMITQINNPVLANVAMSPLESFWFAGAYNEKVEGFLVKPPNFDASKKYPLKFLIHGGPEGAWGDDWSYRWNPELFAANGYVVIMINFHGSTGYGQKFIDAINGDWGGAPFEDLMKGLDYAEEHYGFIDKSRECALGASYGGYMANWILGHTDRFKCIVSHDGMFNAESAWGTTDELWFNDWEFKGTPYSNRAMYQKWSPHQYATNFKTPTLVIHGQRDYRLDVSEGLQLFTTLQMEGVPSKMLYFPDEGDWVLKPQNSQLWYKTVNDWVDQWTKKF
ncbi:MAG: S9 family peptidase [Candidatus Sulfotelmatobacter sp.]